MKRQLIHTVDLRQQDGFGIDDLEAFASDARKLNFYVRKPLEVKLTSDGKHLKEIKISNG